MKEIYTLQIFKKFFLSAHDSAWDEKSLFIRFFFYVAFRPISARVAVARFEQAMGRAARVTAAAATAHRPIARSLENLY